MIPGNLACKAVECILHERLLEMQRRLDRTPPGSRRQGRQRDADTLREQRDVLHDLQGRAGERWMADLDAASLGWLCAWAVGHPDAEQGLVAHLSASYHPRLVDVAAVRGERGAGDIGEVMRRLLGEVT